MERFLGYPDLMGAIENATFLEVRALRRQLAATTGPPSRPPANPWVRAIGAILFALLFLLIVL